MPILSCRSSNFNEWKISWKDFFLKIFDWQALRKFKLFIQYCDHWFKTWLPASRSISVGPEGNFSILHLGMLIFHLWKVFWWCRGGLFDFSVKPGPDLSRLRLSLVQLVTWSIKARFGQFGDQVGQGQGQELDNNWPFGHFSVNFWTTCVEIDLVFMAK